ncbi:MAG: hypothetical protein MJZ32_11355 [Bacteroidaceae bacterium]|nr:hypothetical protein [Bacteroidaceae bacterium]
MEYNSLHDLARRKAALNAELAMHAKNIEKLKKELLTTDQPSSNGKKGLLGRVNKKNILSAAISTFDGAWFAWKLYKKFKR